MVQNFFFFFFFFFFLIVLKAPDEVRLNTLRDVAGARKSKTRVGRGHSSGLGTQSGRGQKGHKARSGAKTPIIFEGGQV